MHPNILGYEPSFEARLPSCNALVGCGTISLSPQKLRETWVNFIMVVGGQQCLTELSFHDEGTNTIGLCILEVAG